VVRLFPALALAWLTAPAPAFAHHPDVDEGITAFENGDFAAAERAFGRAENGSGLRREDLVQILLHRAHMDLTLGNEASVRGHLRRILSFAPSFSLDDRQPPALRALLGELRAEGEAPLSIRIDVRAVPDGIHATAEVLHDRYALVRSTELRARARSAGLEEAGPGPSLRVTLPPSTRVEIEANALGPGGAPLTSDSAGFTTAALSTADPGNDDSDGWPWIVGGALAAVAAVTAVVLVATTNDELQIGRPQADFGE
jgi:hypothetical protein